VSSLDDRIDALYALPLNDFTAARNALARSLSGPDRERVKKLQKPTVIPWAVNLLHWRERKTFERLLRTGRALRAAQLAALKGQSADIHQATAAHRGALADAVSTARQLATGAGSAPDADALSRMLDAVSVSPDQPDHAGRWTEAIRPAGFEALAGIAPAAQSRPMQSVRGQLEPAPPDRHVVHAERAAPPAPPSRRDLAAEKRRLEVEAARRKEAQAAVRAARLDADRAAAAEARAAAQVGHAREQLARAESAYEQAHDQAVRARKALDDAEARIAKLP
jgi:hypothetical protein